MTLSLLSASMTQAGDSVEDYLDLALEDLLSIEVTSVSKKKQRLSDAAAAIFVISNEDIRRSGVTSIPEALRMAPGIQVARIDANKWAISSRGFNDLYANKLLVMIDGRSVYTPAYSGVYWDAQDTLLEDIDRIEVIRGPGATLWGANAVNGVINIITKHAADTQGGILTVGGGNQENTFVNFRYADAFGEMSHGRFYAKAFNRDSLTLNADGNDAKDNWDSLRAGFRIDTTHSETDSWTVQGDIYDANIMQAYMGLFIDPSSIDPASIDPATPPGTIIPALSPASSETIHSAGWNLLARWQHSLSDTSATSLQVYYDHNERDESIQGQTHDTLDIDFQHNFAIGDFQDLTWGLGYRYIEDSFRESFIATATPDSLQQNIFSAFVQDQIELSPAQTFLTLGTKIEHNDFTGFEVQPSIRLLWKPDAKSTLWGSISRAVRTPSRIDRDSTIINFSGVVTTGNLYFPIMPLLTTIEGSKNFSSEELIAYEIGYRIHPRENLAIDIATFYNDYSDLRTMETVSPTKAVIDNKMSGHTLGAEIAIDWRPLDWWRLQGSYSAISMSLKLDADSQDMVNTPIAQDQGSTPDHQFSLRSTMDLSEDWELDLWTYHVSQISVGSLFASGMPTPIKSYTSLNARIGWQPDEAIELSLVGLNLQGGKHTEFVAAATHGLTDIGRSIYAQLLWKF